MAMAVRPVDRQKLDEMLGADLQHVRNDSALPIETAIDRLKAGVEIQYGDVVVLVETRALEQARKDVASLPAEERPQVMQSVDRALRKALPKVSKNVASKKRMDAFYHDILLWTVLKEGSAV